MGRNLCSLVLHLPHRDTAKLAEELRDYLSESFGFRDRTTGKVERGVDVSYGRFGAWTRERRAGMLLYCLKGFDHRAFRYVGQDGTTENIGAALGIDHRGQQGFIDIKRCVSCTRFLWTPICARGNRNDEVQHERNGSS